MGLSLGSRWLPWERTERVGGDIQGERDKGGDAGYI